MRLICSISADASEEDPFAFSYFLSRQGIHNEVEEIKTENGEPLLYRIWVHDEDQIPLAKDLYEEYRRAPHETRFTPTREDLNLAQASGGTFLQTEENENREPSERTKKKVRFFSPAPYGPVSVIVLILCVALFVWAQVQRKTVIPPKIKGVVQAPILAPIERKLLFDYPAYFQLRDRLFTLYTPEDIKANKSPPPEAIKIVQKLQETAVWMGIYDRIVEHFKNKKLPIAYHGPLFEKISQGEVWRLFTPALLHFDLLHIFFNVLWFILLGNQIEFRIGWWRYFILIVLSAVIPNTAQYLMSGPFFMGLSGIVVAMAGFIFARQQVAPWEGYLLHRFTFIFLTIFVVGMFILQVFFFFFQVFGKFEITIGIANTAHIVGGIVGYLLGRLRLFSLQHPHK